MFRVLSAYIIAASLIIVRTMSQPTSPSGIPTSQPTSSPTIAYTIGTELCFSNFDSSPNLPIRVPQIACKRGTFISEFTLYASYDGGIIFINATCSDGVYAGGGGVTDGIITGGGGGPKDVSLEGLPNNAKSATVISASGFEFVNGTGGYGQNGGIHGMQIGSAFEGYSSGTYWECGCSSGRVIRAMSAIYRTTTSWTAFSIHCDDYCGEG